MSYILYFLEICIISQFWFVKCVVFLVVVFVFRLFLPCLFFSINNIPKYSMIIFLNPLLLWLLLYLRQAFFGAVHRGDKVDDFCFILVFIRIFWADRPRGISCTLGVLFEKPISWINDLRLGFVGDGVLSGGDSMLNWFFLLAPIFIVSIV